MSRSRHDDAPASSGKIEPDRRTASDGAIGLLLMLGATACFVAMVTFVKLLREGGIGTAEVMFWRMAPGLPWVLYELRRHGGSWWPRRPGVVALRSVFGGLSMATYFWAVESLSLFQNTVFQLTQPVFVAVLSPMVLRERLRGAAVLALALGLAGALIVTVPPDALLRGSLVAALVGVSLLPAGVRLSSAIFSALAHMTIRMATAAVATQRRAPPPDAPETVVLWFTASVSVVCLFAALPVGGFQQLPANLSLAETIGAITAMAATGMLGQLLLSRAYARSQAPAVAIVAYSAIPMSIFADALVWRAAVEPAGWVGAGVMIVAGVLLVSGSRDSVRPL